MCLTVFCDCLLAWLCAADIVGFYGGGVGSGEGLWGCNVGEEMSGDRVDWEIENRICITYFRYNLYMHLL